MLPVQEKRIRCLVSLVHNGSGVFGAWTQFVGGHVGLAPHFFRQGGHNMPCPPTFFKLGFVFGEVSKIKVMFVTFCVKSFSC